MRNIISCAVFIFFIPFFSCSQVKKETVFNESDYIEIKRGEDDGYPYVIVYTNKYDTNYTLKKIFIVDSTYQDSTFTKFFYFKNVLEGPFESWTDGEISEKGVFKKGKYEGERLLFGDGKLMRKSYYKDGKKAGVWEKYDETGKLTSKTYFDNDEKIIKEENIE
jgi:antitoxin component YwqK of YwqJK toxin-antitoxin module